MQGFLQCVCPSGDLKYIKRNLTLWPEGKLKISNTFNLEMSNHSANLTDIRDFGGTSRTYVDLGVQCLSGAI